MTDERSHRDFVMPDLGEGLEDGEILVWHVAVGDDVALNAPLVDVETAKAVVTVPSPYAGHVTAIHGGVGDTVRVGEVLLTIAVDDAQAPLAEAGTTNSVEADAVPAPLVGYGVTDTPVTPVEARVPRQAAAQTAVSAPTGRPRAKPPVRKLARDLGIDLDTVAPSGPNGSVTRADVQAVASGQAPSPKTIVGFRGRRPGEIEPIRSIRKRIVDKMEMSHRDIPTASCTRDVDMTRLWDLRQSITRHKDDDQLDQRVTPFVLFMRATLLGLRRFPSLNATIVGRDPDNGAAGEIHLLETINLGVAVDTERGLVVPNIKQADQRSIVELAAELDRLIQRSRAGVLEPSELTGGTFTVNNYGVFGNDDADPIINPPEAGILGMGAIRERPWVVDGQIVPRRITTLRLAFDHRICDGGEAGRFVTYVASLCEEPARILLQEW